MPSIPSPGKLQKKVILTLPTNHRVDLQVNPKPLGLKPFGLKPFGLKPFGLKPFGLKPFGLKTFVLKLIWSKNQVAPNNSL